MEIYLWTCTAPPNVVDKEPYFGLEISYEGTLREATSIINPSILFHKRMGEENLLLYNYCYIPEFNRYYYITNVTSENTGLWRIDLEVDVLMSYKGSISNLNCLIARNEFVYDSSIVDELYSYRPKPICTTKTVTGFEDGNEDGFNVYVLACGVSVHNTSSDFQSRRGRSVLYDAYIKQKISSDDIYTYDSFNIQLLTAEKESNMRALVADVINSTDIAAIITGYEPEQSFIKYVSLPFSLIPMLPESIFIGSYNEIHFSPSGQIISYPPESTVRFSALNIYSYIDDTRLNRIFRRDFRITPPELTYTYTHSYMDFILNKSKMELYLPFIGWIELDPLFFAKETFTITYTFDPYNTMITAYVYDARGELFYTNSNRVGVEYPIFKTGNNAIGRTLAETATTCIMTALSNGIAAKGKFATIDSMADKKDGLSESDALLRKKVVASSAVVDTIKAGVSFIDKINIPVTMDNNYGGLGFFNRDFHIRIYTPDFIDYPEYPHIYGRPLQQYGKLGDYHGFTVVGRVFFDTNSRITPTEMSTLVELLKEGVYLP